MPVFEVRRAVGCVVLLLSVGCAKSEASTQAAEKVAPAEACGDRDLPDCPTQGWMKANLQASVLSNDLPRLAKALDQVAAAAPTGYEQWAPIARNAAAAARAGDITTVKAACTACHDLHRSRFRLEMRRMTIL